MWKLVGCERMKNEKLAFWFGEFALILTLVPVDMKTQKKTKRK